MLLRLRSFATRDSRILRVLMTLLCALHVYVYILGVRATEPTRGMVCDERRCMVTSMSIVVVMRPAFASTSCFAASAVGPVHLHAFATRNFQTCHYRRHSLVDIRRMYTFMIYGLKQYANMRVLQPHAQMGRQNN